MTHAHPPDPDGVAGAPADASASGRWLALAVLCVSLLIVTLDNTILNVALPTVAHDLHATSTDLQWMVDAYVMVFAGLLLVAGSLADRIGRKRTFVAGLAWFAAGSAWAAFSGSVGMLIAARASMGIGGALIMPSTLAIITDMFRDRSERQRAIGVWAGTSGLGIALGPITGGLLLAHFWWGSVFLINVPVALAGVGLALRIVPESRNPRTRPPDLFGSLLSIAGLVLVLWAIIEAPVRGWSSTVVVGSGIAGLVVLIGFGWWERTTSHPMLPLSFFRRRSLSGAVTSVGMATFGLFGAMFLLTQFLQFDLGYTPLQAGVRALPAAAAIAVVAPLSPLLVARVGTKYTVALGLTVIGGGLWLMAQTPHAASYADVLPGMVMLGLGAGLVMPSGTGSVMGSVPLENSGVGSATNGTFLQLGGALGVGVLGSLLNTRYQDRIAPVIAPFDLPRNVEEAILGSLGGAQEVADRVGGRAGDALSSMASMAFVDGMDLALTTGAAVALGAAVVALALLPRSPSPAPPTDGTDS